MSNNSSKVTKLCHVSQCKSISFYHKQEFLNIIFKRALIPVESMLLWQRYFETALRFHYEAKVGLWIHDIDVATESTIM